eukprot:10593973-Ditylum_brightwellii.AAC.1
MSCYVSTRICAIEHIVPKVVSETTISLKVMQEMYGEMHETVKEKYGVGSDGIKELQINFKHYIFAHFNSNAETKGMFPAAAVARNMFHSLTNTEENRTIKDH